MRERQFKNPAYWPAIPFDESDISEKPTLKMVKVKPEEFSRKRPRRSLREITPATRASVEPDVHGRMWSSLPGNDSLLLWS